MPWRRRLQPIITPLFRLVWRFKRGMTLGVRGLVTDEEGRVLLIEHTYTEGWHMPGGGVERGETAEAALARELAEEGGVEIVGRARLLSMHSNHARFRSDHVLVYRIESWKPCRASSFGEIKQIGWFAPDALPEGITEPTRRRIAEALAGEACDPLW